MKIWKGQFVLRKNQIRDAHSVRAGSILSLRTIRSVFGFLNSFGSCLASCGDECTGTLFISFSSVWGCKALTDPRWPSIMLSNSLRIDITFSLSAKYVEQWYVCTIQTTRKTSGTARKDYYSIKIYAEVAIASSQENNWKAYLCFLSLVVCSRFRRLLAVFSYQQTSLLMKIYGLE